MANIKISALRPADSESFLNKLNNQEMSATIGGTYKGWCYYPKKEYYCKPVYHCRPKHYKSYC